MNKRDYCKKNVNRKITEDEAILLEKYAGFVKENGLIVDIGTCEGGSAFALGIGSKETVKLVTIDPTPNQRFYMHKTVLGFNNKIKCIEKKSQDIVWDKPIDLLFNDGLHSYNGIVEDNDIYCPMVIKGGFILFHDFILYDNTVGKAVLTGEGKYYKRIDVIGDIYIAEKL